MKNNSGFHKTAFQKVPGYIIFICVFLLAASSVALAGFLKVKTGAEYRRYIVSLQPGHIAEENIIAKTTVDVIDEAMTEVNRKAAEDAVLPVFSYSLEKTMKMIGGYDEMRSALISGNYERVAEIVGQETADKLAGLSDNSLLSVIYELLENICRVGYFDSDEVASVMAGGHREITLTNNFFDGVARESVVALDSYVVTTKTVTVFIVNTLNRFVSDIDLKDIYIIRDVLLTFLEPNVNMDQILYRQRIESARNAVEPTVIHFNRGDMILERDTVVTGEQIHMLSLLGNQTTLSLEESISDFVFQFAIIFLLMLLFIDSTNGDRTRLLVYCFSMTVLIMLSCVVTYFNVTYAITRFDVVFIEPFLPVLFVPVFLTMASGQKIMGMISSLIISTVMLFMPDTSIMTFFYSVACGAAGVFLVRFFNRRLDSFFQWIFSIAAVCAIDAFFMFREIGFDDCLILFGGSAAIITTSILLIQILLPIYEKVFRLPTNFRLNELAFSENPLLTRLEQAAPGTYSHSKNVADLARAAAEAVGANEMIAYVGGLYHDIGKTEHPEYFVENQAGENRHEELNPNMSASIIKNHVRAGAQRGKEAGLPSEIIDIIANHHGNDVISYFFYEAKKDLENNELGHNTEVRSEDFRYQAEIPSSRECAIVMICDGIEAAARTINAPTPAKFSKLINQIILSKIERGQLNDSKLTMEDIDIISKSVLKTLSAQYHSRIEYPDENKENKEKKE